MCTLKTEKKKNTPFSATSESFWTSFELIPFLVFNKVIIIMIVTSYSNIYEKNS